MGLSIHELRRLMMPLGATITMGRQNCYAGAAEMLAAGFTPVAFKDFIDAALIQAGARPLESMDASAFEGASIVHDLNKNLDAEDLRGAFDTLIDSGTAEHVYDIRQCFQNYADLLRIGGKLYLFLPANNYLGHGFYQFSPDVLRGAFSVENGFEEVFCYLGVPSWNGFRWFYPRPVQATGERNAFHSRRQAIIHFCAVKRANRAIQSPIQTDYALNWSRGPQAYNPEISGWRRLIVDRMPRLRHWLERARDMTMRNSAMPYSHTTKLCTK